MAGTSTRENGLKETVTLKWCTPRSNNIGGSAPAWVSEGGRGTRRRELPLDKRACPAVAELHYCTGAYRISPTDVNSRPSSCLTNFLLNGEAERQVLTATVEERWVSKNGKLVPQVDRCCWSSRGSRGQRSSATC